MKKLFVFQKGSSPKYQTELESAYKLCRDGEQLERIDFQQFDVDCLESVDVVVSNRLPYQAQVMLRGLKIVSVIFDSHDDRDDFTDICIDHLYNGKDKYFSGEGYTIYDAAFPVEDLHEIFELISLLEWDSKFWGFSIAFLSSRHLSENILFRVSQYVRKKDIRLIEYLCNCHDKKSVRLAEQNGYEFKDIRLTYEKKLTRKVNVELNEEIQFGSAQAEHIPALRKMSRNLYLDSRYYYDRNIDKDRIAEFYMDWVEKAVKKEYDDECYVYLINQVPKAYCSVKYNSDDLAQIGLVGVSNSHTGKGLGGQLMHNVSNSLIEKGCKRIQVVTQGRNYPAQRLYQKNGFLTHSTELWYHKWVR